MLHKLIRYKTFVAATEDMDLQYKIGYRVHSWNFGHSGDVIVLYQRESK